MLIVAAAALAFAALDAPGVIRWPVIFAAVIFLPGSAIMSRIPVDDVGAYVGLAVALSLAVGVSGATVMTWFGWWHPMLLGALIAAASCAALVLDLRAISRERSASSA